MHISMEMGTEGIGDTCPHFFTNLYVKHPLSANIVPFFHVRVPMTSCVPRFLNGSYVPVYIYMLYYTMLLLYCQVLNKVKK